MVRVFYPHARDHVIPGGLFAIDNELGWEFKPGKSATHHTRYFDVTYTINSFGFRDKPRRIVKDVNIYRVLLFGDSQVFGWGVSEDERFSSLIEKQRRDLEIWNLAVPGYGLDQEILSYKKDAKSLNADEVIFFVSSATLGRMNTNYIYKKYKPMFEVDQEGNLRLNNIPAGKTSITQMLYNIFSKMYLPYFAELRFEMLKEAFRKSGNKVPDSDTKVRIPHDRIGELEKKLLIMTRNLVLERKQKVTILLDLPEAMRKVRQDFYKQNGIGWSEINLDDENPDFIFGRYDRHWSPQAHQRIAEQLVFHWTPSLGRTQRNRVRP